MEQLFLFDDEFVLRNQAAAALLALQPGEALEQLEKCRALYPGNGDWEEKIRIASFLQSGLAALPPALAARLFFRGIVLCDNEPFLRMCKGIDFADVRREMKAANGAVFAAYLRQIDRR
jgi:hypothetical protein